MVRVYGINNLAQFMRDKGAGLQWVAQAEPGAMVTMDDPQYAQAIRIASPNTLSIHRAYHPEDHRWHEVTSPANWLAAHRQYAAGGNILQVFNEVFGYTDLRPIARWSAELMALAAGEGIRLCMMNWGVGHPDVARIYAGELDELFHAFNRYPMHLYGVHEYAVYSTVDERPFRIGRFLESYARIDRLGLQRPRIVVTETGRDVGGGINDGWKAVFTEQQYVDFLHGLKDFYSAYDVCCCVFCAGQGANGMWGSFDVENANYVLGKLAEFNQADSGSDDMAYKIYRPGSTYLNIRRTPEITDNVVGTVRPHEQVQVIKVTGGFAQIRKQDGLTGNVSEQGGLVVIERL